jgi:hypothetical protein
VQQRVVGNEAGAERAGQHLVKQRRHLQHRCTSGQGDATGASAKDEASVRKGTNANFASYHRKGTSVSQG